MTDRKQQADQNKTPEDVAKLYSWANLQGAKYREFSAERAQGREQARQRVEAAQEEERRSAEGEEITGHAAAVTQRFMAPEMAEAAVASRPSEGKSGFAGEAGAPEAAPHRIADDPAAISAARQAVLSQFTQQSAQQFFRTPPASQPMPASGPEPQFSPLGKPFAPQPPQAAVSPKLSSSPLFGGAEEPMRSGSGEPGFTSQELWAPPEARENSPEPPEPPAWLSTPPASNPPLAQPTPPPVPQGALQESRDRVASRWYALRGVFDGANASAEEQPQRTPARTPALAIFSLAGGVGKTMLAATLGRALSAQGERVLLIDTAAFGLLPFYFGARDHRVGVLRTFSPPGASGEAPVQLAAFEPETMGAENGAQDTFISEAARFAQGASRVIVDLSTASGATARRILRLAPTVLVPLAPDMNSAVSVGSIEEFFQHNHSAGAKATQPYYVLNQFDALLPLHLDVREALREQLGERLLPFVIRHSPVVSEALAEGMTVMDYAPEAPVVGDFENLANWLKHLAAPASQSYRGVRWSER